MGQIHVHEFMSLDGVIDAPTWTFDYGFDPQASAAAVPKRKLLRLRQVAPMSLTDST